MDMMKCYLKTNLANLTDKIPRFFTETNTTHATLGQQLL